MFEDTKEEQRNKTLAHVPNAESDSNESDAGNASAATP
jgi:hypothetical protein